MCVRKGKTKHCLKWTSKDLILSESGFISWRIICYKLFCFCFVSGHRSHSQSVGQANFNMRRKEKREKKRKWEKRKRKRKKREKKEKNHHQQKANWDKISVVFHISQIHRLYYPLCLLTPLQLCQHLQLQGSISQIPSSFRLARCRPTVSVRWAGSWTNRVPIRANSVPLPAPDKQLQSCVTQLVIMTFHSVSGAYHLASCFCEV